MLTAHLLRAHPQEEFGVGNVNVGYGIERLKMINCPAQYRYCWRHLPKRMNYSPGIENLDKRGRPSRKDRWLDLLEPACFHCGNRLDLTGDGQLRECQIRKQICDVCGVGWIRGWERHGPERPLESFANLRFIRIDRYTGLAIRDLNGIRDLREKLVPGPKVWPEDSYNFNLRQLCRDWRYVQPTWRLVPRFSFTSPVERSD